MDILVVLTGRRGSAKDSVADIAIQKFGALGKVALADWFKKELSNEFKIPLVKFYSAEKDATLSSPIVISRPNLRALMQRLGFLGFNNMHRVSTSRWEGRQINSIRELMLWFGHEVVTGFAGDEFHCKVTEAQALSKMSGRPNHANLIFITDARQYIQSKYFLDKYPFVFPVLVTRSGGSADDHPVEKSVDEFPSNYFFHTVENDGTLDDLEDKVKGLLVAIKDEVTRRSGGTAEVIKQKKKVIKKADETNPTTSPTAITGE